MELKEILKEKTARADRNIAAFLPAEEGFQKIIFESCNYSVINGGKRLRPLMMECAYILCRNNGSEELSETERAVLEPFMAAMEMIHSSSLVHDDLPCMDNDVLRRGKPSTWAKFGEDFGTLAGDGLMLFAFETAAKSAAVPEAKCRCMELLARKSGIYGMIGGQTVDVQMTGKRPSREQLEYIYRTKTGALIEASFMIGGILAGADEGKVRLLEEAASCIGMAFQIEDDILDVTSTQEELGKPIGSDSENGKITWLSFYGLERSRQDAAAYTARAMEILKGIGSYPFFEALLLSLVDRKS